MNNTARQKFIFSAILAYMVLALLWIFMSDRLLAVFTDISAMVWLSMIKGVLFVVVSAAFFYIVLGAVPPAQPSLSASHWLDAVSAGVSPGRLPRWSTYLLAVILTLLVVLVRQNIAADFAQRPLLMLLMFPIIVSALFGGLGPGLVSTALAALLADYLAIPPLRSFAITKSGDLIQWGFLIINGLVVSLLSEAMRRSLARQEVNRRLLDTVISGTSDAVFIKDRQGRYLLANAATGHFVGKAPDEIVGHDDRFLFAVSAASEVMALDQQIMEAGRTQTHEEVLTTLDGEKLVFLVTKGPMLDDGGKVVGMFGISHDITERRRGEDEIRRLNQTLERRVGERTAELRAANDELADLAYALTHNLGGPLRAIGGFSQVLLEDHAGQLDAEARSSLQQIIKAGTNMAQLVEGILVLLRCTQGELSLQPVDVSRIAMQRLAELASSEPAHPVVWQVDEALQLFGDADMLKMALLHLLDNAWKFTRGRADAQIHMFAGELYGKSGICIADNGAGFDTAYAQHLFQPFQRLHRQDEFPGAGIGLATVQRIVLRHGGEISAEGKPGVGATFCISLPPLAALKENEHG